MLFKRSAGFPSAPRNNAFHNEKDLDKRTTEKILRDVGCSRKAAKSIIAIGYDRTAAKMGWPVDTLRDAGQNSQPQPVMQRDAVEPEPPDILENLMNRIFKLTRKEI